MQIIAGGGVVVNGFAKAIAATADAQVVAGGEEELVAIGEIDVQPANRIVESVALTVGVREEVGLPVRLAGLIGLHVVLQVVLGNRRDAIGGNDVIRESLAGDATALGHAGERIEQLIDGTDAE